MGLSPQIQIFCNQKNQKSKPKVSNSNRKPIDIDFLLTRSFPPPTTHLEFGPIYFTSWYKLIYTYLLLVRDCILEDSHKVECWIQSLLDANIRLNVIMPKNDNIIPDSFSFITKMKSQIERNGGIIRVIDDSHSLLGNIKYNLS